MHVGPAVLSALAVVAFVTAMWSGIWFSPTGDDSKAYIHLARMVTEGRGLTLSTQPPYLPSSRRPPVYPLFLAAVFLVGGESWPVLLVVQAAVFGTAVVLSTVLAGQFFDRQVAITSGLLMGLNPTLGRWAGAYLNETLYMGLAIATVLLFARAMRMPSAGRFIATGLAWALTTLCKPLTVLLLPLLLGAIWLARPTVDRRMRCGLILVLSGLVVIGAWTIRNYVAFNRVIPFQARGLGVQFWMTTIDPEDQPVNDWVIIPARWVHKYPEVVAWKSLGSDLDSQRSLDAILIAAGVRRITSRPFAYIVQRIARVPRLWLHSGRLWYHDVSFRTALAGRRLLILAIKTLQLLVLSLLPVVLSFVGIAGLRHRWRELAPLLVVPAFILLAHLPLWIEERYGAPAVPFLLTFAAWTIVSLGRRRKQPPDQSSAITT